MHSQQSSLLPSDDTLDTHRFRRLCIPAADPVLVTLLQVWKLDANNQVAAMTAYCKCQLTHCLKLYKRVVRSLTPHAHARGDRHTTPL